MFTDLGHDSLPYSCMSSNFILEAFVFVYVCNAQHWAQDTVGFPIAAEINSSVLFSKNDGIGTSS